MEKIKENKTYGVYNGRKKTLTIYKKGDELPIKGYIGDIARQTAASLLCKGFIIINY